MQLPKHKKTTIARGVETRGGWGVYIPPIIWLYPPQKFENGPHLHPPNNLNGCTSERKLGEKSVLFLMKTFFFLFFSFWSSPEFGEKERSIFDEDLFFGLHLNLGKKVFHLLFFGLH